MNKNKFSIIIPANNLDDFANKLINSALFQNYGNANSVSFSFDSKWLVRKGITITIGGNI